MIGVIFLRSTMILPWYSMSLRLFSWKQCSQGSWAPDSMPSLWRFLLFTAAALKMTPAGDLQWWGKCVHCPPVLEFVSRQWIWSFSCQHVQAQNSTLLAWPHWSCFWCCSFWYLACYVTLCWLSTQQTWEGAHLITGSHGPHDKRVGLYSCINLHLGIVGTMEVFWALQEADKNGTFAFVLSLDLNMLPI